MDTFNRVLWLETVVRKRGGRIEERRRLILGFYQATTRLFPPVVSLHYVASTKRRVVDKSEEEERRGRRRKRRRRGRRKKRRKRRPTGLPRSQQPVRIPVPSFVATWLSGQSASETMRRPTRPIYRTPTIPPRARRESCKDKVRVKVTTSLPFTSLYLNIFVERIYFNPTVRVRSKSFSIDQSLTVRRRKAPCVQPLITQWLPLCWAFNNARLSRFRKLQRTRSPRDRY